MRPRDASLRKRHRETTGVRLHPVPDRSARNLSVRRTRAVKRRADPSTGPLAGIRILDLSSVVLGPFATMALGDLGAEIIKVESPAGDSARWVSSGRSPGMSGTHMNLNRNKRSIALDLRKRTAQQAVLRLAGSADALFHNMRPKAIERLGLDYDAVRRVRPGIVYCVCTGYDSRGPFGGLPAYDDLIQGASGLADLVGRAGDVPAFVPMALCDKVVGLTAAYALTAALVHRERTGEGQHIEVPMYETMVSFVAAEHLGDSVFEPPREKFGYARILSPDRRPYRTMDGHLCVLAYTERQWKAFFRIAGLDESLLQDPRFSTLAARTRNTDALYGIVAEEIAKRTTAEWLALLQQAEIPAMPGAEPRRPPREFAAPGERFPDQADPSERRPIPFPWSRTAVLGDAVRCHAGSAEARRARRGDPSRGRLCRFRDRSDAGRRCPCRSRSGRVTRYPKCLPVGASAARGTRGDASAASLPARHPVRPAADRRSRPPRARSIPEARSSGRLSEIQ